VAAQNPLRAAQQEGIKAVNGLGVLIGRLGTTQHPNSKTMVAYRNANRALTDVVNKGGSLGAAKEVTAQLRTNVRDGIKPVLKDAVGEGYRNAVKQLQLYELESPEMPELTLVLNSAYGVMDATLQKQEAALTTMLLTGTDESLILGDDSRAGVLRATEVILAAAFWVAALWWKSFDETVGQAPGVGGQFSKQAVAALDRRTTECCLRVHGQIQPLNSPFHLTGSPAYTDYLDWPPFHAWCRTSGVLYKPEFDDGLTQRMTDSAQTVLDERARGIYRDRHPADAFI
jgi:hypothetical protein